MQICSVLPDSPQAGLGNWVIHVDAGGPAAKAGLNDEDLLLRWEGTDLQGAEDVSLISELSAKARVGEPLTLEVLRDGEKRIFEVDPGPPSPRDIEGWLYAYVMLNRPPEDLARYVAEGDSWLDLAAAQRKPTDR